MKFVLVSGLFCDLSILYPLRDRLIEEYPGCEVEVMSTLAFKTVWSAKRAIRRVIDSLWGKDKKRIVLMGHSAAGQVIIPFIDDPRVKAVISICPPGHNPLDMPLQVWSVQFLYTIQTVLNQLFCIKEKHRSKLFGGLLPEYMKALSYGWFALQMSMGALLGNFSPKTRLRNKFLAFWSTGDPTVLPKAVVKMAIKHNGVGCEINCGHHYPLIEPEGLDQIMFGVTTFLRLLE